VQYPSLAAIPQTPQEAALEPMPHRKVHEFPIVPRDQLDMHLQNLRMFNAGVLLPELVNVSKALATEQALQQAQKRKQEGAPPLPGAS
jgi:hypothetical protein